MTTIIGWDIGGANLKAVRASNGAVEASVCLPFEMQRRSRELPDALREALARVGAGHSPRHAVTMTAELSQAFRSKAEGVGAILDAVEAVLGPAVQVYTTDGTFATPTTARGEPLRVAAANWHAAASLVARHEPDAILLDMGTTTTDIIPIAGGRVAAQGRTDPERLGTGELVYTGAVRTPVEAIVREVPVHGVAVAVAAEGFALSGDVHVWRGTLAPADYATPTPDGRPPTRELCGERLARAICADRTMLDDGAIDGIADAVASAQLAQLRAGIARVMRHAGAAVAVVAGVGERIAADAARAEGLGVRRLAERLGAAAAVAPAAAVALLLDGSGT